MEFHHSVLVVSILIRGYPYQAGTNVLFLSKAPSLVITTVRRGFSFQHVRTCTPIREKTSVLNRNGEYSVEGHWRSTYASGMAEVRSLPRSRNTIDQTFAIFKFGNWSQHTTSLKNSNSLDNLSHYSPSGLYVFSLIHTTVDFNHLNTWVCFTCKPPAMFVIHIGMFLHT